MKLLEEKLLMNTNNGKAIELAYKKECIISIWLGKSVILCKQYVAPDYEHTADSQRSTDFNQPFPRVRVWR